MIRTILRKSVVVFLASLVFSTTNLKATDLPFAVKNSLYDQTQEETLGLVEAEGTETITIFSPTESTDQFSNGVIMTGFKDSIYCQWQCSATDEDADETYVAYSASKNGKIWTAPRVLAPTIDNGYCSSGGWWVNGDTLVAYLNTWPDMEPRGGYTRYITSTDGFTWSEPRAVKMANGDTLNGIFEQDPRALPNGRIINAVHFQPGLLINPVYTDDSSGVRGWVKASYSIKSVSDNISQEIEPSSYLRGDDALVMIFRDQQSSYKKLASVSTDNGETWTTAVETQMPDARTKQSAGNIADSAVYMVGNPNDDKLRIPLAITLSSDGKYFNTAYLLRAGGDDIQDLRYEGTAKRSGYHYPKTMIWNDTLYVSYATNKEDVEFTRVPLASLKIDTSAGVDPELSITDTVHDVEYEAGSVSVKVTSNIIWYKSESSSWLSASGTNDTTLKITYKQNTTVDPRSDTVTVSGPFVESRKIVINQEGGTSFFNTQADSDNLFTVLNSLNNSIIVQNNSLATSATINILNLKGQRVYEGKMNSTELTIDLSGQKPGAYIVQFITKTTVESQRIIL